MPTAARLVAAIAYAAVAYLASESFKPLLPEGTKIGYLSEINAFIGLLCGWFIMGRLVGPRHGNILAMGFRSTASMLFYILLFHSLWQMLRLSMRLHYDGPMDAVIGVFEQAYEYGIMVVTSVEVMAILLIGGAIGAYLANWINRRWN